MSFEECVPIKRMRSGGLSGRIPTRVISWTVVESLEGGEGRFSTDALLLECKQLFYVSDCGGEGRNRAANALLTVEIWLISLEISIKIS